MKKPRDDLTSVLARLQQLEATNEQQCERIAALEEIIASRLRVVPPALAATTMTPKEAAYALTLTKGSISQLVAKGKLRATRIGGRMRIFTESVENYR